MTTAPEPLYKDAKTVYEWFLNVYCWFSELTDASAADKSARRGACTDAWLRFRRTNPDILQTKDKTKAVSWIAADFEARQPPPSREHLYALLGIETRAAPIQGKEQATSKLAEATTSQTLCLPKPEDDELSDDRRGESSRMESDQSKDAASHARQERVEVESDDPPVARVVFEAKYFEEYINEELDLVISQWSPEQVRDFILDHAKKPGVKEDRVKAIAAASYTSSTDGSLLEAGGADLLVERTVGTCKWEKSILKRDANKIFDALRELREKSRASYWQRNAALQRLYQSSVLREHLQAALAPRPREEIRYVTLCTRTNMERGSVTTVNDDVSSSVGDVREQFKVVSVVTPDDVMTVLHNVIYYHEAASRTWVLLASVDFMQHGESAPSGHWHLNRAPLGELVPHWGPSNDIFHGDPVRCPLWWHLIPEGMKYHTVPSRAPLYSWTKL